MKKLINILLTMIIFNLVCFSQTSHLSLVYDFEGNDFDFYVTGMVGIKDSLYIICNTPDGHGKFFSIDENGKGYKTIWEFDSTNYLPMSLLAYDTVIYGTTFCNPPKFGGSLFKYSLNDYKFRFIKDFEIKEVPGAKVKFIKDSLFWFTYSEHWQGEDFIDYGGIFSMKTDGTKINKIFSATNFEKGKHPKDFVIYNDSIYISCENGGSLYSDAWGTYTEAGCFIRIKTDGTGYEMLIKGGNEIGTNPESLLIRENKLFGLFTYSGKDLEHGGQFFRSNLDGTAYDSIGGLASRSLSGMLSTDSLIYGVSGYEIFGINPFTDEIRIYSDLLKIQDLGWDICEKPALLNGNVYMATQMGGPNGGGTILKWSNQDPEINAVNKKSTQKATEIVLSELFTDPEGDSLTYSFEFNHSEVEVTNTNGKLIIKPLKNGEFGIKITANDGWVGYNTQTIIVSHDESTTVIYNETKNANISIYPNPSNTVLFINNISQNATIVVIDMQGKSILNERIINNQIDITELLNGVYILQIKCDDGLKTQKFVKSNNR